MPEKNRQLYDSLIKDGLYTKSYDDFVLQFSDPQRLESLYGALKNDGHYSKPIKEFSSLFFPHVDYTGMGIDYMHNIDNLPVSDYTKKELIKRGTVNNQVDKELLNKVIDVNSLAGNPSYKEPKYKAPLEIVKEKTDAFFGDKPYTKGEYAKKRAEFSQETLPELRKSGYTQKYKEENSATSTYNPILNKITGSDYVAEEAHGFRNTQEKSEFFSAVKDWLKDPSFSKKEYKKGYSDPERFEYDTHKNVEPVLKAYIRGKVKYEDIPSAIEENRNKSKQGVRLAENAVK